MKKLKSHFNFNRSEQSGILLLVLLILVLFYFNFFHSPSLDKKFNTDTAVLKKLQNEIDSLKRLEQIASGPKIYPFNPNFITDYKSYTLGMTPAQFDKLEAYRASGQWINSVLDFKTVTGVSQEWLDSISPFFKFPNWITNPKTNTYTKFSKTKKTISEKMDLNTASATALQEIYGVGEVLSKRIIAYREKIGGFSSDIQLNNVFGLEYATIQKIKEQFTVKTPKEIVKINVNKASASDIATIPGISFSLAKKIWEYRKLREHIESLNELTKIEEITPTKFALIQLYLSTQ